MKTKNLLIAGGVAFVGLALLGAKKVNDLTDTFDKITIKPVGGRNLKFPNFQTITFNLDVEFKNPTSSVFSVSGLGATLTKVVVNYQGAFLGVSMVNMTELTIPAYGTAVVQNLPIIVNTPAVLENVLNLIDNGISNLEIVVAVEVFGSEYFIRQ